MIKLNLYLYDFKRGSCSFFMYLKRIEMQGFKSFVEKTVLEFDKGITAVVGPNGSGKSNISDAARWVLGEQSPKSLRCGKMEDVIFAGTQTRKPVGMSEVSLVMDNEDGVLNIDYSEVKITRKLYRSGESEYYINGAPCRLKDIHLLFADTGIGKDGYSIIGQGKVDQVLNSKSEDRRSIFEDASGIMKYRMQKQESERKLSQTEQNLLRINDIINMLSSQIKPLERQSVVAKKYLEFKYELRDIEVGVLAQGTKIAGEKLDKTCGDLDIFTEELNKKEKELEAIKKDNYDKTEKSKLLADMITSGRSQSFELEKRSDHFANQINVNNEKIKAALANKDRLTAQSIEGMERTRLFDLELAKMENQRSALDDTAAEIDKEIQKVNLQLQEANGNLNKTGDSITTIKDEVLAQRLLLAQSENNIDGAEKQIQLITQRKYAIDEEIAVLESNKTEAVKILDDTQATLDKCRESLNEEKQIYKNSNERLVTLRNKIEEKNKQATEISGRVQSDNARLKLITELEEGFEGYAKSVKEVLQMCKTNTDFGKGIHGAVAQIITVSEKYETAIETALGHAYQDIITETEEDAKKAIEYLKQRRFGRATFLPLTAVNGRSFDSEQLTSLRRSRGFLGVAAQVVEYDTYFAPAIESLLGKIAVFDNIDNAFQAARTNRYSFMCVTLEGDIIRTSGAVTGGSPDKHTGAGAGALSRTREIPVLKANIDKNVSILQKSMEDISAYKEEIVELEAVAKDKLEITRRLEREESILESKLESVKAVQDGEKQRRSKLVDELKSSITNVMELQNKKTEYSHNIQLASKRIDELNGDLKLKEIEFLHFEEAREHVNQKLIQLRLKEADIKALIQKQEEDKARYISEIRQDKEKLSFYETEAKSAQELIEQLKGENSELEGRIVNTQKEIEAINLEIDNQTELKTSIDMSLDGMFDRITAVSEEITKYNETINKLSHVKQRLEEEINGNVSRLWEEYELTIEDAYNMSEMHPVENYEQTSKRINELKGLIKDLGPVNVNAIEEFENVKTQYEFMSSQCADITLAKQKLEKVINELNVVMRQQFADQFKLIRDNFKEVFVQLFGGGTADIVLTEGNDILECGIDIHAQPPGKKLQNMMLLSGGERALTAIALLFAILKLRPSPFCLLDEIEAALDESNVYRLSKYLKTLHDNIQFIMVTHRKGTMENAGALYGVTMEEKGVSKVVSIKL